MNIKRILSGTLAAIMLAAGTVLAEEDILLISANPTATEEPAVEIVEVYDKTVFEGTLKSKEESQLYIVDTEEMEIVINTDENTIFTNGEGLKVSIEELNNGEKVKVIASSAMAQSLPPQVYGYVVMTGEELPIYVDVKEIEKDDDENTVIVSKDGTYRVVISEETEIAPFAKRNIVRAEDIKEDSRILVFASIMTMSLPAVVPAEKIVILPELVVADETEETEEAVDPETIVLNGETLEGEIKNIDGTFLLPVRTVCEKAGLDVAWDNTLKAVSVGTIPMGVTFNIGKNEYTKARMMPQELSSAPVLADGLTYVPTDFFTEILGATVENADGALNIELKVELN